ncbi:hypothetical protein EJ110_NYTH22416 [Nymphaea thermarum]|nr:hypothetical protein EJ110_NYTH22416 [Nymphaea thermarum]
MLDGRSGYRAGGLKKIKIGVGIGPGRSTKNEAQPGPFGMLTSTRHPTAGSPPLRFPSDRSTRRSSCIRDEWWERVKTAAEEPDNSDKWWVRGWNALRRVREWSEIVARPKWKTFIRRFNRNGRARLGKYQYDPLSYKLNFDEGGPNQETDYAYGDFSTRFAAPLNKSRDLSNDMPVFMAAH